MKLVVCAIALMMILSVAAAAAETVKVNIAASDQMLSAVVADMSKQVAASIIVDSKSDTKVNLSLADTELPKALDAIAKLTKLTWKKVQFAKATDSKVSLDQIKSTLVALAAMPLVAVSVADNSGKGAAVFARDQQGEPDTAGLKLPDGYSWVTAYVIYDTAKLVDKPAETAKADDAKAQADRAKTAQMNSERMEDLARMSPDQRKQAYADEMADMMTLSPNARRQFLQDQFSAAKAMDPKLRQQYLADMRSAMRNAGVSFSTSNNRGNNRSTRPRNIVIPAK